MIRGRWATLAPPNLEDAVVLNHKIPAGPEQGAATPLWAATTAAKGGAYCADCHESEPYPHDDAEAARLWRYSAELTGRDLPR